MSYRIEYTGSLVDRRDLPQATVSSSLTKTVSTPITDARHTFAPIPNGSVPIFGFDGIPNQSSVQSAIFNYNSGGLGCLARTGSLSQSEKVVFSGGTAGPAHIVVINNVNAGFWYGYVVAGDVAGKSLNYSIVVTNTQYITSSPRLAARSYDANGNQISEAIASSPFSLALTTVKETKSATLNFPSSAPTSYVWLAIWFPNGFGNTFHQIWNVSASVAQPLPVTITTSTFQHGSSPVGGTLVNALGETIQSGTANVASPVSRFGLAVKDGGTTVAEAKHTPAADSTEDAYLDSCDEQIITAQNGSLTVETEGTDLNNYADTGSSVIVEDVDVQTENV